MEYEMQVIDTERVQDLVAYLMLNSQGPRDAYALLVCAIWQISKLNDPPISVEQLAQEFAISIQTLKQEGLQ